MPTPFPADIGLDFAAVVDGLSRVTVRQTDPDTGATLATAENVTCLAGDRDDADAAVGDGEAGGESTGFTLLAREVGFEVRARDRVTDEDGVVWSVDSTSVEGRGALYVCEATRMRANQ
jgi:hypothetical protein